MSATEELSAVHRYDDPPLDIDQIIDGVASPSAAPSARPVWLRFLRGRPADPAWVRPALLGILTFTAMLYLTGLSSSGYANSFYSGAVQAATKSWKAFFFGSSDASNFITVDKPPAALWIMDLSARIFGVSSWSILAPQALEGVASVGLLYLAVRRTFSAGVGILAALLLALTPAAAVMFRFNNPDALLVLILIGTAYATLRAVESGKTSWLILAGSLVGLGFMTKMLQALLIVPPLGLVYLVAGPPRLRRRVMQLLASGVALFLSAGWWVAAVQLTPASDRPYIGGSQNNSLLNLIFGYNGLGRLSGSESGSVGFTGPSSSGGGGAGVLRMFNGDFGVYIAWLLPAALMAAALGFYLTRRAGRTDPTRAAFLLWGGWLFVTGAAFSLGRGIIHPYYSIALAPPIAALTAAGAALLWARRSQLRARVLLAGIVAVTLVCTDILLTQSTTWSFSGQATLVLVIVVLGTALVIAPVLRRRVQVVSTVVALVACLAGAATGTVSAALTAQHNAVPSVGSGAPKADGSTERSPTATQGAAWSNWLLLGVTPSRDVTAVLGRDARRYTWVAAATGSERAASYQLATGGPVMAVGGFNGTDPTPTLPMFQRYVAGDEVHYFIDGAPGQWLGGSDAAAIATWVEAHFTETTVDGVRLYDLAGQPSASPGVPVR